MGIQCGNFRRKVIFAPLLALALTDCVSLPPEPSHQGHLPLHTEPGEEKAVGLAPEWGLAMSGGGLRSALFSIGVMKALFDARQLDRFRIVSTVSGGSYAAYWLYSSEYAASAPGGRFGDHSFGRIIFNRRTCELMSTGNFVPYSKMAARGLSPRGAIRLYDERLARTFGSRDNEPPVQIGQMRRDGFPYLVINATLIRPRPSGWRTGLWEVSPTLAGNAEYGYLPWSNDSPPLRQIVSVSGAAVQPLLKQQIVTPNAALNRLRPVATDGGTSENLGAIALIRRGIPNIVIIDAEHDPAIRYGAYVNLRDRLRSYNSVLNIPSIEAQIVRGVKNPRVGPSFHVGTATSRDVRGRSVTSRIFYLKMRISPTLEAQLRDEAVLRAGEVHDRDFRATWLAAPNADCTAVDRLPPVPRSLFLYNVAGYGRYINERSPVRFTRHLPLFFRGQFPHYLTPDQSFYNDQVLAFMGLGLLEGEELAAAMACAS